MRLFVWCCFHGRELLASVRDAREFEHEEAERELDYLLAGAEVRREARMVEEMWRRGPVFYDQDSPEMQP